MRERILITGAAGFVGSHVVEHLLRNTDWEICVLDKLTYASRGMDRLRDIQVVDAILKDAYQERLSFYTADIARPLSDGMLREIGRVDYILHMAAETHVDNSITSPRPFVVANVMGTFEMLQFARMQPGLKQFIYFSTDEVFGPAMLDKPRFSFERHEIFEDRTTLEHYYTYQEWDRYNSTNPYSATKAAGEELALAWSNTYGIPVMITHTMNVFGERQHPEKFIPMCVRKILNREKVTIHSDKLCRQSGTRHYIHARNVASAILFLLKQGTVQRDKFNIVGEKEVSNLEMAAKIAELLDIDLKFEMVDFHSSRPGHDLRYALDGNKLKDLGWEPGVYFESSLRKTVQWMVNPANRKWLDVDRPMAVGV